MEMEDDALYLQLHKLSAVKSEEALDQLVSTLWKTRKTGLRSFQEKSNLQSLLNLPFLSDLDLVLACVRSLIRKWVYENFSGDDLLKLFPPDLPLDIQSILLVLFQKYQSQWMEEISSEQHSLPRSNITNQDKEGAPTSFPSLNTLAPLWPRQDDPVYRLNQNELGASTPIHSDTNVSRLAPITQRHDVVPPENLRNLPRLKSMTWTMENGSSVQANRLAVVSLKMQDYSKSASGEIEVKFQLTKDTLEAMLRSMTYISEQLSELVSTSSEPTQKKQKHSVSSQTETIPSSVATGLPGVQITMMFSHLLSTKLDAANFLQWRQQVLATIKGNCMMDYNKAQHNTTPPEFLNVDDHKAA